MCHMLRAEYIIVTCVISTTCLHVVLCPRPYFSGIGCGNITYIELFQWNSIIVNVTTESVINVS